MHTAQHEPFETLHFCTRHVTWSSCTLDTLQRLRLLCGLRSVLIFSSQKIKADVLVCRLGAGVSEADLSGTISFSCLLPCLCEACSWLSLLGLPRLTRLISSLCRYSPGSFHVYLECTLNVPTKSLRIGLCQGFVGQSQGAESMLKGCSSQTASNGY